MAGSNKMTLYTLFLIFSMMTADNFGVAEASNETTVSPRSCTSSEELTVRIENSDVSPSEGIVEACVNGTWGYICGSSWNVLDANVVCSSLGFTRAVNSFTEFPDGYVNDKIFLYNVDCRGNESSLFDCPYDISFTESCNLGQMAGVACSHDEPDDCIPGLCRENPNMEEPSCEPLTDGCWILPWNDMLHCKFFDVGIFFLKCLTWEELGLSFSSQGISSKGQVELIEFIEGTIISLETEIFNGFTSLHFLYLDNNNITEIQPRTFEGLLFLRILNLSSNSINYISQGTFDGLESLRMLDLSYNPLIHIEAEALVHMRNLEYLFLVDVYLPSIDPGLTRNLTSLTAVSASDSRICCLLDTQENISCARTSPRSPLDTCGRLYPSVVLRIFGWIIGLTALIGNINVLILRFGQEQKINVQTLLIINLAVVDCLMGVYMIIITSADVHFGDTFFLSAPWWRDSDLCKVASVLAFLSSELSVLTLTLITLDRLICIMFPFGKYRFDIKVTAVILVLLWLIVLLVGILPFVLISDLSGIYGLSDVCLGLPLDVDSGETGILRFLRESEAAEDFIVLYELINSNIRPSWIYSVVIFIAINMVLFIFILVCYILMFIEVKRSSRSVGNAETRRRDIKVAKKMAFIVGTNFACWMPIIVMGILTQAGLVVLPSSLYAWVVIFILPINSSLNPVIYTFLNERENKRKPEKGQSTVRSISKNARMTDSDTSTKDTSA